MLSASYKNLMGSKSYLCTRPDVLQAQQKELDLHKNRLNTIRKEGSFLKKYIDSKPIEIKHNMKTDAIKANENYAILQKNTIIHERLNILKKKTTPIKNKKDSQNGFTPAHHSLVNRKREAKRIEEENKKTYKRMHVLLKKGSIFSSDKFKKHTDKYEKALNLRKRTETSPAKLQIVIQKDNKNNVFSPKRSGNPSIQRSQKYNHFNIKLKDYSTLMLTAKSVSSTRKLQTME